MFDLKKRPPPPMQPELSGYVTLYADEAGKPRVVDNATGAESDFGGPPGPAGTVEVIATETLPEGSAASVANSGSPSAARLTFHIPRGTVGGRGLSGWSPRFGLVADANRRVLQLQEWIGGEGEAPTAFVGQYLGPAGYVAAIADAADVRGVQGLAASVEVASIGTTAHNNPAQVSNSGTPQAAVLNFVLPRGLPGFAGWSPHFSVVSDGERRVMRLVDWIGGEGDAPSAFVGHYVGATGYVEAIGDAADVRGAQGSPGVGVPGQSVTASDEGVLLTAAMNAINFVGSGVTATASGNSVTVSVPTPSAAAVGADPAGSAASAQAFARQRSNHTGTQTASTISDFSAAAAAAAPVTSVAGKTGAVTLTSADVGLGNVVNPVAVRSQTVAAQNLTQTLAEVVALTVPANTLTAGAAFDLECFFSTLTNTITASTLEVEVLINGTRNALCTVTMGTTTVAAPGRGGRAFFRLVFRSVGTAGTAIALGTVHVNNLANFSANTAAAQAVNTTADVTIALRARTSAASTTGVVQIASIQQAT